MVGVGVAVGVAAGVVVVVVVGVGVVVVVGVGRQQPVGRDVHRDRSERRPHRRVSADPFAASARVGERMTLRGAPTHRTSTSLV